MELCWGEVGKRKTVHVVYSADFCLGRKSQGPECWPCSRRGGQVALGFLPRCIGSMGSMLWRPKKEGSPMAPGSVPHT